ncbi:hypothetical protein [Providencia sp.]|uniref:hypothetical protein n=1 Tax=Providencia sp. TaxID=589 RepID=UPI003340222C
MDDQQKQQKVLKLGLYRNRGRVAVLDANSPWLGALQKNPVSSQEAKTSHSLFSWLIDKPRMIGETKYHFVLSTLPEETFSGFAFHSLQGLFVDSFNSPHEWREGEPRAQEQIADLLLPSGQWHRHYDIVVLSESANDKQVELIRHWLELTGGSLLIIRDSQKAASQPVQQLIAELSPVEQNKIRPSRVKHHGYQHTITLSPASINALKLTDALLENTQYFSIAIHDTDGKPLVTLHDIALERHTSWNSIAQAIEFHVNQEIAALQQNPITVRYQNNTLNMTGKHIVFSQFQLKQQRGEQILPILVTENPHKHPNQLIIGTVTGQLAQHDNIQRYQILEQAKFGDVTVDPQTGEWIYIPHETALRSNLDQFDLATISHDGRQSAPISIHLQTDEAPQVVIPGKRTFTLSDPIYQAPKRRYHPTPEGMQVHAIQLAQTHLQSPNDPYFSLIANRWALLKVDITHPYSANSPDLVAIVSNKEKKILARVALTGPDNLPTQLTPLPNTTNPLAYHQHAQSFTAPIKGEWVQPGFQIVIVANQKALITPETNQYGLISPNVTLDSHITAYVDNYTLYQHGHGIYAYSPLSWGQEAVMMLPIKQLTLYSPPATTRSPGVHPYKELAYDAENLIHPKYDDPKKVPHHLNSQINWAYLNSSQFHNSNHSDEIYHYSAIHPFTASLRYHVLGLARQHAGGGIHEPATLWHEIFGHGLGLPHTNVKNTTYPYDPTAHGRTPAYNQHRQHYSTYQYQDKHGTTVPLYPAMYSSLSYFTSEQYDAFLPHSDYFNQRISQFLSQKTRWQPNHIKGEDIEDNNFAGDGFYQRWNESEKQWETLTQENFTQYYPYKNIDEWPHRRDVPVYWLRGQLSFKDDIPHPYNTLLVDRTIGNLSADYHNLETGKGRPYYPYHSHAIVVTYATPKGLITEKLQVKIYKNDISLNIADKGELVKFAIYQLNPQKELGREIIRYTNPSSLANRLFANSHTDELPEKLILDNYWQGNTLFWASTDADAIDFSTGKVNKEKITPLSALKANWVVGGKLHQQYFSLSDPFGVKDNVYTSQSFTPINHLNKQIETSQEVVCIAVRAEQLLIADMNIYQEIDITSLSLPEGEYRYWVTLKMVDKKGEQQEKTPLEDWHFSHEKMTLTVRGTIDSTPGLECTDIVIHIDSHLQDSINARKIWLVQDKNSLLTEDKTFLDYHRPVVFNALANQAELISALPTQEAYTATSLSDIATPKPYLMGIPTQ